MHRLKINAGSLTAPITWWSFSHSDKKLFILIITFLMIILRSQVRGNITLRDNRRMDYNTTHKLMRYRDNLRVKEITNNSIEKDSDQVAKNNELLLDSVSTKDLNKNTFFSVSFQKRTWNNIKDDLTTNKKTPNHTRLKRGVIHLYNMIVCATGCNPLAYKGYGCYCGFLGSGYVIDGIDRCCKMHDWCYDATECPVFMEYVAPYYWTCYRGYKPVCAVEHGEWGGSGSCAQRLCECDRSLAECLSRYPCPTSKAVCTSSPWRLVQNLFMIM